jgi:hypothetical protein
MITRQARAAAHAMLASTPLILPGRRAQLGQVPDVTP